MTNYKKTLMKKMKILIKTYKIYWNQIKVKLIKEITYFNLKIKI